MTIVHNDVDGDNTPYKDGVPEYAKAGWDGIIPVKRESKTPVLRDVTGRDGRQMTADESIERSEKAHLSSRNLALRLPRGIVGVDVDDYDNKQGAETLARFEAELGPLPEVHYSSARGPGVSGIRFYRVPEDLEFKGILGKDIELIQFHHRFAVVYPSIHPNTGTMYRWYDPDGSDFDGVPSRDDLVDLPEAWVNRFKTEAKRVTTTGTYSGDAEFMERYSYSGDSELVSKIVARYYENEEESCAHDAMITSAMWAACSAVRGEVDANEAREALEAAFLATASDNPGEESPESEFARIWEHAAERAETTLTDETGELVPEELLFRDAKLAEIVASDCFGGDYMFVPGLGWFFWSGKKWQTTTDILVRDVVRRWINGRYDAAVRERNHYIASEWEKYMSHSKIGDLVNSTKGAVLVDPSELDADPDLINVQNGTVHLSTLELRPHNREDRCTRITSGAFRPGADMRNVDTALQALPDAVRDYAQLQFGQGATGYMTPDDKMFFLVGRGANGKTTLLNGVSNSLGEYASVIPDKALLGNPGDHSTELMEFRGVRFAMMEELPESGRLCVTKLKKTVGTPVITARLMRQDNVTFKATHTLFVSTNHLPSVVETDWGTWRRLEAWEFPYKFVSTVTDEETQRQGDRSFRARALGDHDAFLTWTLQGAAKWYANGKTTPEPPVLVEETHQRWRGDSDLVIAFFEERLTGDTDGVVASNDLLEDFNDFLRTRGQSPWSMRTLVERFEGHDLFAELNVTKSRVRKGAVTSRPRSGSPELPNQVTAYKGVSFGSEVHPDSVNDPFA